MVKQLIFFNNGNVAAFDQQGKQVPEVQSGNLFVNKIHDLLAKGLIDKNTLVSFQFIGGALEAAPLFDNGVFTISVEGQP